MNTEMSGAAGGMIRILEDVRLDPRKNNLSAGIPSPIDGSLPAGRFLGMSQ
jgi:hypothetical protein